MKGKVSISETGAVRIATPVQMQDFEIAELFGVMIPTIRSNIRAILKTGIATADLTNGSTLVGNNILPDYHGLDMIIALAFRVQSFKAKLFREWIMQKSIANERQSIVLQYNCHSISTIEQN